MEFLGRSFLLLGVVSILRGEAMEGGRVHSCECL